MTPVKLAKVKVGDKLKAQVAAGVTLPNGPAIPTAATVMGEVTAVDGESVTLSFSRVDADGKKIPVTIALVAVAQMGGGKSESSGLSAPGTNSVVTHGAEVHSTAGSVIGLPGVVLAVDDGPPYASKFQLGNKEKQLPKGVQLMFTVH